MPSRYTSSADTHAMVARIAPSILELLNDGIPRNKRAIIAALAERHAKDEVMRTLMRLAVTSREFAAQRRLGLTRARRRSSILGADRAYLGNTG